MEKRPGVYHKRHESENLAKNPRPQQLQMAVEDLGLAAKIVRYFLEKGQLLPGTVWKTNHGKEMPAMPEMVQNWCNWKAQHEKKLKNKGKLCYPLEI